MTIEQRLKMLVQRVFAHGGRWNNGYLGLLSDEEHPQADGYYHWLSDNLDLIQAHWGVELTEDEIRELEFFQGAYADSDGAAQCEETFLLEFALWIYMEFGPEYLEGVDPKYTNIKEVEEDVSPKEKAHV